MTGRTILHRMRDAVMRQPASQTVLRRLVRLGVVPRWISAQVQPVGDHPVRTVQGNEFRYRSAAWDQMARRVVWTRWFDIDGTVSLLGRLLPPNGTLVDVGAYAGAYALAALSDVPTARAICVEPNPRMFRALRDNIDANAPSFVIEAHEVALTDFEGEAELLIPHDRSRASLIPMDAPLSRRSVRCATLDGLMMGRQADVIKVDVEGGEPAFLRGAVKTISASQPALVMEFHADGLVREALSFLADLGSWRCWYIGPEGLESFGRHHHVAGFPNFLILPTTSRREHWLSGLSGP